MGKKIRLTVLENNIELFFTGKIISMDSDSFVFVDKFGKKSIFRISNIISAREAEHA